MVNEALQSVPWWRLSDAVDRMLDGYLPHCKGARRTKLIGDLLAEMRRRTAVGAFETFAFPAESAPETKTNPGTGSLVPLGSPHPNWGDMTAPDRPGPVPQPGHYFEAWRIEVVGRPAESARPKPAVGSVARAGAQLINALVAAREEREARPGPGAAEAIARATLEHFEIARAGAQLINALVAARERALPAALPAETASELGTRIHEEMAARYAGGVDFARGPSAVRLPVAWAEPISIASVTREIEPKTDPPTFIVEAEEPLAEVDFAALEARVMAAVSETAAPAREDFATRYGSTVIMRTGPDGRRFRWVPGVITPPGSSSNGAEEAARATPLPEPRRLKPGERCGRYENHPGAGPDDKHLVGAPAGVLAGHAFKRWRQAGRGPGAVTRCGYVEPGGEAVRDYRESGPDSDNPKGGRQ